MLHSAGMRFPSDYRIQPSVSRSIPNLVFLTGRELVERMTNSDCPIPSRNRTVELHTLSRLSLEVDPVISVLSCYELYPLTTPRGKLHHHSHISFYSLLLNTHPYLSLITVRYLPTIYTPYERFT